MKFDYSTDELPEEFADAMIANDLKKAFDISCSLAQQGNASAEHSLGWFYRQGADVEQSNREAYKWWSISAPKGIPESQAGLGLLYYLGEGTKANYQKAFYWLSLATKNGETYVAKETQHAKDKLTLWQYVYIKLLLLLKT